MKKHPYKISVIILACLLLVYLPVGCGTGETTPVTGTQGGVLNLYGIDPHTLDPAISADATSHEYVIQLFGGLVLLDDNLEPAPDIAREWKVSNGGRTYTFYLKENVHFHDGRAVNAEDFKYSWERACWPETWESETDHPTPAVYLNDIVGVEEVLEGRSKEISGIRVIDNHTLEVTIDTPKSFFLPKLTYPTTYVVDRNNVKEGSNWWHKPNGTGPFKLKKWDEGSQLILERYDNYHGDVANLDSVIFHLWTDASINLYENGEIDVAGVYVDFIDKVMDIEGDFFNEMVMSPELSFYYIGFNTEKPPFDDANIRRAFSMAIDKDKIVSLRFRNMAEQANGILPPGMPGYNKSLSGLEYDVNTAKELIRQSSYEDVSNLPPITLTTSGWGGLISGDIEAIIHQWRQNLGVVVEVRQIEPERFLYHMKQEIDDMYDMGWIADYPHPQDFLEVLFHSEAEYNYGEYSNPEVDDLLKRAGEEMATEKSLRLYQQAEAILIEDAACIPLWFGQNYILVKPYVKGYRLNPMGIAVLNKVSIEAD
ncbi:ABC transporter substrate-binding protein [Chloroflexota bacterium]